MRDKIGLVIQRYGEEICGGAELHCKLFAKKLAQKYEVHVITTTAIDDVTWKNHYSRGITKEDDVIVHRFKVDRERISAGEQNLLNLLKNDNHSYEEEITVLQEIGPYSSELFDYIRLHHEEYRCLIFFVYYYYQTSIASIDIKNAILLPCAHDEPNIRLKHYTKLFKNTPAFIFNTNKEKQFIENLIQEKITVPHEVIGCGIDRPKESYLQKLEQIHVKTSKPYLLYIGRIIQAKGCDTLIEYFLKYNQNNNRAFQLVLIGKAGMDIPQDDDIINLGYVSEDTKNAYIMNAQALVQPSIHESLSLVLLEALSYKCPVIVPNQCAVTKEHIELSNGGWIYDDYISFSHILDGISKNETIRTEKGKNGYLYVTDNYTWDNVISKLNKIINIFPKVEKSISDNEKAQILNPAYKNKNIPVVFSADDNYVPYLSVALQSLIETANKNHNYDIIILSDNISLNNQRIILTQNTLPNISIRFLECSQKLDKITFSFNNQQLSRSTFTRLFCLDLLSQYEKVVYLDCDIIIKYDIAEILNIKLDNYYIAAVQDQHIETIRQYRAAIQNHLQNIVKRTTEYFNAGVLVLNLSELRKYYTTEKLLEIATQRTWLWEDQDVLNYITNDHTYWLSREWNVIWLNSDSIENLMKINSDYLKSLKQPKIIHYAGGMLPTKQLGSPWATDFKIIAKKSPFYESLLLLMLDKLKSQKNNTVNSTPNMIPTAPILTNYICKCKLFNFLPIFSYKRVGGRNQWKIFGLPIFKMRHMANGITSKYYILGIPVLKVSKKSVK